MVFVCPRTGVKALKEKNASQDNTTSSHSAVLQILLGGNCPHDKGPKDATYTRQEECSAFEAANQAGDGKLVKVLPQDDLAIDQGNVPVCLDPRVFVFEDLSQIIGRHQIARALAEHDRDEIDRDPLEARPRGEEDLPCHVLHVNFNHLSEIARIHAIFCSRQHL